MVWAGETVLVPFGRTVPMLLIDTVSAFSLSHASVEASPELMVTGEAVNRRILGSCRSTCTVSVSLTSPLRLRAVSR